MIQIVLYTGSKRCRKRDAQKTVRRLDSLALCSKDLFGELASGRPKSAQHRVWVDTWSQERGRGSGPLLCMVTKSSEETKKLMKHWPVSEDSCHRFKNLRESTRHFARVLRKAKSALNWTHDTNTPHHSETHGVLERAVRRAKEGTAATSVQSGLPDEWWDRDRQESRQQDTVQKKNTKQNSAWLQYRSEQASRKSRRMRKIRIISSERCCWTASSWAVCSERREGRVW